MEKAEQLMDVFTLDNPALLFLSAESAGKIIKCSKAAETFSGKTSAALCSCKWQDVFFKDDAAKRAHSYLELLASGNINKTLTEFCISIEGEKLVSWTALKQNRDSLLICGTVLEDVTGAARHYIELERNSRVLKAVNSLLSGMFKCENLKDVAALCLDEALFVTDSSMGFIGEITKDKVFNALAFSDSALEACRMEHSSKLLENMEVRGIWGAAAESENGLIINLPSSHPACTGVPKGHVPIETFLGVPLKKNSETVGVIALANKPGGFTESDLKDVQDISAALTEALDRKKLEIKTIEYLKEINRRNRELDDFAYIISHDLKEPLRGITSFSAFLLDDLKDISEESRYYLEGIGRLARRMNQMISDLLHYARLGKDSIKFKTVDVKAVIKNVAAGMKHLFSEKNAELLIDENMPPAAGDLSGIVEIYQNLLGNALKYNSSTSPKIEAGWYDDGVNTVYFVKDNGIGIKKEHQEAAFRLFRRLNPRDRYEEGTGAGLTIVKKIIEKHGGSIRLESEEGLGSCFYFTLCRGKNDE
jgi:signal transduction histidine kinase